MPVKKTKPVEGVDLAAVTKEVVEKRKAARIERETNKLKNQIGRLLAEKDACIAHVEQCSKDLAEAGKKLDAVLTKVHLVQTGDYSGLDVDTDDTSIIAPFDPRRLFLDLPNNVSPFDVSGRPLRRY